MKEGSFKCTASEGRSLFPVLACWAENVLKKHEHAEVVGLADCYLLLAEVLTVVERTTRRTVRPEQLRDAVEAHLKSYLETLSLIHI